MNNYFKKFIFCFCWFFYSCLFGFKEFDFEYKKIFGFSNNGGTLNARV